MISRGVEIAYDEFEQVIAALERCANAGDDEALALLKEFVPTFTHE